MKNSLEQSQKQIMSQNMIQSVEILQMSSQELHEYMKEMSLENPVVELEENIPESKEDERLKKLEWLSNLDEQNRAWYKYDREDSEESNPINNVRSRDVNSLADSLHLQLLSGGYSEKDMEIFDFVANNLDSRGYYTAPLQELMRQFHISLEKAEYYLNIMRDLEPAGVCAASLKDCLIKQLERRREPCQVELAIIKDYMELLGKNQLHVIAKNMNLPLSRIKEALAVIQTLNPKPAQGYDNGEALRLITPDITIVKLKDRFEILLNNYTYPVMHVNKDYLSMLRSDCDDSVKEYLYDKVRQVEQVQDCINRRNKTLLGLAQCIVDMQKEFFLYGEESLRPCMMKDAAERLGLHESTVSRAVKDKYLQCCWGVYPLNYFFSRGTIQTDGQMSVSAERVKQELARMVEYEDKEHPLSDQKLTDMLKESGYDISRRTVAKYREAMKIPNCRLRKQF